MPDHTPPLPPVRDLAAELVDRGDGWHVSPELMPTGLDPSPAQLGDSMTITPDTWTVIDDDGTEIYLYSDQARKPVTIVVRSGQDNPTTLVNEYTWRHNRYISVVSATRNRADAERHAARVRAANPGDDIGVVTRSVTEWTAADTHNCEETRHA